MGKRGILALTLAAFFTLTSWSATNNKLIILHTNDTHSQIDPNDDGLGGVARRKTVIDSVRNVHDNVMLVDAGDAVQGTLYFPLYKGEVENKVADFLGYDIRILGNHEFDNGAEELMKYIKDTKSTWIASNYDLENSVLADRFVPYVVREFDGRKIAFMALNLNPKGIVSEGNYNGVKYLDIYKAADATAWHLKNREHADIVVALTHIGYFPEGSDPTCDQELAAKTENIDIIIGGHSHTVINPATGDMAYRFPNAAGEQVLVAQTGRSGRYIGEITIDLGDLSRSSKLITLDKRLDKTPQPELESLLAPYRVGVDSIMNVPIARTVKAMAIDSPELENFISDFVKHRGDQINGSPVDFAIFTRGGIRRGLPKGNVSEGVIISMLPFDTFVEVIEISGKDLLENFDIMALQNGQSVSKEISATFNPETHQCTEVLFNGKPLDPHATYRIATLDYTANGGDYMVPLTRANKIGASQNILNKDFIHWLMHDFKGKKINPEAKLRMRAR